MSHTEVGYVVYIHHQHEPGLTVTHAYSSRGAGGAGGLGMGVAALPGPPCPLGAH